MGHGSPSSVEKIQQLYETYISFISDVIDGKNEVHEYKIPKKARNRVRESTVSCRTPYLSNMYSH
jgi:glutathionylspermidine synthase